jgi:hypothetical protein
MEFFLGQLQILLPTVGMDFLRPILSLEAVAHTDTSAPEAAKLATPPRTHFFDFVTRAE